MWDKIRGREGGRIREKYRRSFLNMTDTQKEEVAIIAYHF